jgi:uncharacterized protein YbaR (Trm112 family)
MPLSQQLLEKLSCPKCGGNLSYRETEEQLDCRACRLTYAVTDDIPVLLVDEAKPLE